MNQKNRLQSSGIDPNAFKVLAFELSPDPALVINAEGSLVAVNEAAETLFGQGLGLLARGRFRAALPPGSALVSLLNRAIEENARVRERGIHISLFGLPPFEADGAAVPLGDGSVLLNLSVRHGMGSERGAQEVAGLRSLAWDACWRMKSKTRWQASAVRPNCSRPVPRPKMCRWRS